MLLAQLIIVCFLYEVIFLISSQNIVQPLIDWWTFIQQFEITFFLALHLYIAFMNNIVLDNFVQSDVS